MFIKQGNSKISKSISVLIGGGFLVTTAVTPVLASPVVYEGSLLNNISSSSNVDGFGWGIDNGANVDFWRFSATTGNVISIVGSRIDSALDPAFSLYLGTTTADTALFNNNSNWGGLTHLTSRNDDVANPGPGGDPSLLNFLIPTTGDYTIAIGGDASSDVGPYNYNLIVSGITTVPLPASVWLFGMGLSSLYAWARRRQNLTNT